MSFVFEWSVTVANFFLKKCLPSLRKKIFSYGVFIWRDWAMHRKLRQEFILEHYKKYSDPDMPPVWKTLEVITFGTFLNFIATSKTTPLRRK